MKDEDHATLVNFQKILFDFLLMANIQPSFDFSSITINPYQKNIANTDLGSMIDLTNES